jgi:chromate reductase, NAD(P)H dehydrogenase (quinone)
MPSPYPVAVLIGSLRAASWTRKVTNALIAVAPETLTFTEIEIGALPLYNQDLETDSPPPAWTEFRERMQPMVGVLFATPEYNRSVPAALKNAIDVGSRPMAHSVWRHKPAAIISVTNGALGAFGANHHLRQSLVFIDMPTMAQPEAYIGRAETLFDANGELTNIGTREFLKKFAASFATWVDIHVGRERG